MLKFDLDPSLCRVVVTALLLFVETFLGLYIALMKSGAPLTIDDVVLMVAISGLAMVTLLQTFVKGEVEK